jgi:hypothetical protein
LFRHFIKKQILRWRSQWQLDPVLGECRYKARWIWQTKHN